MTPEQREWLEQYAAQMAIALHLDNWRIHIRTDPPGDEDAQASIDPTFGQKSAALRVSEDFFDLTAERQREVITHEIVHLHVEPAASFVRFGLIKPLGQATYDVVWAGFVQQMEYAVDGLSIAIAEHMPMPEMSAKPKSTRKAS